LAAFAIDSEVPGSGKVPRLAASGLTRTAGGRTLVASVDIALAAGTVTALVGRNGSGKSTLLKMLARQVVPDDGAVRLDGTDVENISRRLFARRIGYLPQQLPAAQGMTAGELIACGRYPWHGAFGRFGPADSEAVAEAMRLAGVEGFGDRLVDTLSGGERQRVWIAMLIAQQADWLLMDEPISALDMKHQIEVLDLIRGLSRDRGVGVLVVLHDINLAARFADRIVALRDGSVVAEGPPEAMMKAERLEDIFGLRMAVLSNPRDAAPIAHAL
jgi:iron-chelate-transporting ATPase